MIGRTGVRSLTPTGSDSLSDCTETQFAQFYAHCFPRVRNTLAVLTRDSHAVEDATQEAFVLARRHWPKLSTYDRPEAWVQKVALRRFWRIRRARPEQSLEASEVDLRSEPGADVADHVAMRDELHAAIRALPPRRAEVVTLHHLRGYSTGEVASILNIGESTVRTHLVLARQDLHRLLSLPDADNQGEAQ